MTETAAQPSRRALAWRYGVLVVERLSGALAPATFVLRDGRQASPLQIAPWFHEPQAAALRGGHRQLRGEWACVPFGYPMSSESMGPDWAAVMPADESVEHAHGFGANHDWDWGEADEGSLALSCTYPETDPVVRLDRTVRPDPDAAAIDLTLGVTVRRACRLPVGLHFTFKLPGEPGAARLEPGRFDHGRTHPGTVEPGAKLFAQDRRFDDLASAPGVDGATIDASRLPFAEDIEDLLQLNGIDGTFAIANEAEGYRARISWDPAVCPSVLLWMSNRGRKQYPWSGRHLAIGIEPIASAFGLGPGTAALENPIAESGTPTTVAFDPETPFLTRYRLEVEPL